MCGLHYNTKGIFMLVLACPLICQNQLWIIQAEKESTHRNTGEPALENGQNPSLSLHPRTPTRTHFKNGLADKPP